MIRALALAVALASCGAPEQRAQEQEPPEGPRPVNVPSTDSSGQPPPVLVAPYNLPSQTPVYPGAAIRESYSANPDGSPGGRVVFQTTATPEEVADFYLQRLRPNVSQAQSANTLYLSAPAAHISISPDVEGGARVRISFPTES